MENAILEEFLSRFFDSYEIFEKYLLFVWYIFFG